MMVVVVGDGWSEGGWAPALRLTGPARREADQAFSESHAHGPATARAIAGLPNTISSTAPSQLRDNSNS